MSKKTYVYARVEEAAWDTMMETLAMDSESIAFDRELREEISDAMGEIEILAIAKKKVEHDKFKKAFGIPDERS